MQVSYLWLKELTGLDWPVQEMADRLTLCGLACEEMKPTATHLKNVVVGEVLALAEVPGASKIRKATVSIGAQKLDLICGAPNVAVGQKVPVAMIGAVMHGGMEIKTVTIRGVQSSGMICSEAELGISDDHSGIMVLENDAPLGKPLAEWLDFDDYILGFEITPNRGDALSAIGIARDLAALGGVRLRRPNIALKEISEKAADVVKVRIDDPVGCPRYAARVIRNVRVGQSPWWVQKKLLTAGMRPISNVVDITNLVMLECGHPLHAFDLERFGSHEVVVRRAHDKEKFITLDESERELTSEVLMITNGRQGVAVGGVMGGLLSGITDRTNTILLEAAYFNPVVIRHGRKEIGLVTESSYRFERGADPNNVPYAIDRAAYLFQELCGGQVLNGVVDCYPRKIEPVKVALRPKRCNALMGVDLPTQRIKDILEGIEFGVSGDDPIAVTVPTFRPDTTTETDVIEEIARIHGWANIPDAVTNKGPLFTPVHPEEQFEWDVRRLLAGIGFDEIMGHGLAGSKISSTLSPDRPTVKISNPVSDDLDIMRNSMLPTALTITSHNHAHRIMDLRLFEIGAVYCPPSQNCDWSEPGRLSLVVTGQTPANWRDKARPFDFYDLKAAVETLAEHFHWPELSFRPVAEPCFDSSISYELLANGTLIGHAGRITAGLAKRFDIKQELYYAELMLPEMIAMSRKLSQFTPLPVYPSAPRDLAIVVGEETRVGEIVEKIKSVAGPLAESVSIFDLYIGKQIEKGKKSIGVSITYRSAERSLASDEVDKIQQDIITVLKRDFNAEIREK
ncbi:phenylalanine--tRNA ligase subunit beta [candidate division GN15 bacterium]|uniref:Phenylalanine--tRNA ligase beta subunit n=1 Tax=candidate division GN15 bacterium TaxID=2072418 RepID=A0A855X4U9_9BACT|nr:MAG: phenylalanine--tRNA ligase subunit beta [candidate division GN15 bacterium]